MFCIQHTVPNHLIGRGPANACDLIDFLPGSIFATAFDDVMTLVEHCIRKFAKNGTKLRWAVKKKAKQAKIPLISNKVLLHATNNLSLTHFQSNEVEGMENKQNNDVKLLPNIRHLDSPAVRDISGHSLLPTNQAFFCPFSKQIQKKNCT